MTTLKDLKNKIDQLIAEHGEDMPVMSFDADDVAYRDLNIQDIDLMQDYFTEIDKGEYWARRQEDGTLEERGDKLIRFIHI